MNASTQLRGDTKANWLLANPVLLARETVMETDTLRLKIGDGVKTYSQLAHTDSGNILEYSAQLYQAATDDPVFQFPQISSLNVGDPSYAEGTCYGTNFRGVIVKRVSTGVYDVSVVWDTIPTTLTKLAILFGDAAVRIVQTSQGSGVYGAGVYDKTWRINTYTAAGVLADGVLLGNNGTYVNVKLYPTV